MKTIYFISGIGADERAFRLIKLPDYELINLEWIEPLKNESISEYSFRLSTQIKREKPIIIGLSLGGIVASEISSQMETEKTIIISSLRSRNELPLLYKFAAAIRLHKIIPVYFYQRSNFITDIFFGVNGKQDKGLLKNILAGTDTRFLKWSINAILNWNRKHPIEHIIHIHGTHDRIIPSRYVKADYLIQGGTHLMVFSKAKEISVLLQKLLNDSNR